MKTVVTTTVKCETDEVRFGYWHPGREEWVELGVGSDLDEASAMLGCHKELLDALIQTMDILADKIGGDLRSIWKRLDDVQA